MIICIKTANSTFYVTITTTNQTDIFLIQCCFINSFLTTELLSIVATYLFTKYKSYQIEDDSEFGCEAMIYAEILDIDEKTLLEKTNSVLNWCKSNVN
jgi:hypothetical protein